MDISAAQIQVLHTRALAWLAEHRFYEEALEHALAINKTADAVVLFAQQRPILMNETHWQQLEQQLRRFPKTMVESDPNLSDAQVWLLYYQGRWEELPAAIEFLRNLLAGADLSPQGLEHLQGEINTQIALVAFISGNWDKAIACAGLALNQTPEELWMVRVLARGILALVLQGKGQLSQAYQSLHQGFEAESTDSKLLPSPLLILNCFIHWIAADLDAVMRAAQRCITLSEKLLSQAMAGGGRYHFGAALYQQNRLAEAAAQFERVTAQPYAQYREFYVYGAIGLALTYQAQNCPNGARVVADQILAFMLETRNTTLLPVVEAFQAELALRQGRLDGAIRWAKRQPELPPLVPMFRPYEPYFTLIKVWLKQNTQTSRRRAVAWSQGHDRVGCWQFR